MSDIKQAVKDWFSSNVPGGLENWVVSYIDDDRLEDDIRDLNRWNVAGVQEHITEMLGDLLEAAEDGGATLDRYDSLEEAFGLNTPGGDWFLTQLLEFFWLDDAALSERDRKAESDWLALDGGAVAVTSGWL